MSGISFSGLATGLPPGLVDQLVELERLPIQRFQQRIATLKGADTAWGLITESMSKLRSATDGVLTPGDFAERWSVASAEEAVATATRTGIPSAAATIDLDVLALAERQSSTNADRFTGSGDADGGRTATIDGTTYSSADGTIGGLVAAINADDTSGVTARLTQVEPGSYQLQLTADETGTANGFTVTGGGWGAAFTTTQTAADAVVEVDGLRVSRSTNTFDDLIDGVSLTLSSLGQTTVSVGRDIEGTTAAVKDVVDNLNGVLAQIENQTRYTPGTGTSSPLTGNSTARRIASKLTDALLRAGDGTGTSLADLGISITREGRFTLDESKLAQAFTDDFDATVALFTGATAAADSAIASVSDTSAATRQNTYAVNVTTAATTARAVGTGPGPGLFQTETMTITQGSLSATVTIGSGTSRAAAADQINTALTDAGITGITAGDDGGALVIADSRYGSAHGFDISSTTGDRYGIAGSYQGTDAVVEVDGQTYTGDGRTVTVTDGDAAGLVITAGAVGSTTVTVNEGIAGLMDRALGDIEGVDGLIASSRNFIDGRIEDLQDRIEAFERRVEIREAALRRRFANLEVTIGQLNSTSSWLTSQLGATSPSAASSR